MWSQLWAYTLRMNTSQGQNKLLPCSNNTLQQMDHLMWKQNTFLQSSICCASIAHISYIAFLVVHMLFLIFSHLVSIRSLSLALYLFSHPSLLPAAPSAGIVTGGSSENAQISRCLLLQKCISEQLAFKATMQDEAETNIVGRFATLPPEYQLASLNCLFWSEMHLYPQSCEGSLCKGGQQRLKPRRIPYSMLLSKSWQLSIKISFSCLGMEFVMSRLGEEECNIHQYGIGKVTSIYFNYLYNKLNKKVGKRPGTNKRGQKGAG